MVDTPFSGGADDVLAGHAHGDARWRARRRRRRATPVGAYADPIFPIGALGSALVVKLVNNALFAANIQLVAQAEQIANDLGVDTPTLAHRHPGVSGASYVMGLIASMGSTATLVDAAGHYMRKDIDVVAKSSTAWASTSGSWAPCSTADPPVSRLDDGVEHLSGWCSSTSTIRSTSRKTVQTSTMISRRAGRCADMVAVAQLARAPGCGPGGRGSTVRGG